MNKTVPVVTPPPLEPVFSVSPTVEEIVHARVFPEPLVPVGGEARAMLAFHRSGGMTWRPTLGVFIAEHPDSPWRASLLANLGALHARLHAYGRALESLKEAWQLAKAATDTRGRAVADYPVGEWLTLAGCAATDPGAAPVLPDPSACGPAASSASVIADTATSRGKRSASMMSRSIMTDVSISPRG